MGKNDQTKETRVNTSEIGKSLTAGAWYTICNVVQKGASMLLTPFYTRTLTLDEYGLNSTLGTWFSITSTIVTGDLSASVQRSKYEFENKIDEYISSVTFFGSLITLFFYVVVLIFKDFFCELFGCGIEYFHLMFGYFLVCPAISMLQTKNHLENKYKLVVFITMSSFLLTTFFNVLMLSSSSFRFFVMGNYGNDRIFSMYIGSHIPMMIVYTIIYIDLIRKGKVLFKWEYWKFAMNISFPLIPHILSGYLLNNSDRIIIKNYWGTEYVALYSVTYTCSAIVSMFFNSLNQAWVPWFNEKYHDKKYNTISNVSKIYYLIFFALTLGVLLAGPEILFIFGGDNYSDAVSIMPLVKSSCFCQFNNGFFVNVEMYEKKTIFTAVGTGLSAVINVILNLLLVPKYGYKIAAYTTFLSYFFLSCYHYIVCRKLTKNNIKNLFPIKMMSIIMTTIVISIPMLIVVYKMTILRYTLLLMVISVVTFVLFKFRKEIFDFLKSWLNSKK